MTCGVGVVLMSCDSGKYFAEKILPHLNRMLKTENLPTINLTETVEQKFENTEIKSNILESIRGKDVYIVQDVSNKSNGYSVNDNVLALKTLIYSAKRSDAYRVNVILPTFPYARQDKSFNSREGITAKMFASEMDLAGVDHIITIDIHNPSILGFFDKCGVENLKGFRDLYRYALDNIPLDNLVVSSPDLGGIKRASLFANELSRNLITIYKERNYVKIDTIDKMVVLGDVKGKDVLLIDDMLDTGGTMYAAINLLKENEANKVYVMCSLPFFNGKAVGRFDELYAAGKLEKIIGTNAVYHEPDFSEKHPWFVSVNVESYFAKVILNLHSSKSVSDLLKEIKDS